MVRRQAAFMGYGPIDDEHAQIGPRFAGKLPRSVHLGSARTLKPFRNWSRPPAGVRPGWDCWARGEGGGQQGPFGHWT